MKKGVDVRTTRLCIAYTDDKLTRPFIKMTYVYDCVGNVNHVREWCEFCGAVLSRKRDERARVTNKYERKKERKKKMNP